MLSNVMSLVPKLTEVQEFIFRNEVGLAFFTETWLRGSIADSVVNIPGYTVLRRDRTFESHGGVCLYIRNEMSWKYNQLEDFKCCDHHEVLWVHLKPTRLPRGFPCLVAAIVYHPKQNAETDASLREHLFDSLTLAEARYPNCAFAVCGDFNRFNTQQLTNHFRLKQIVKVPTRKDATLDLIMTNLYEYYSEPKIFPPFGLSDHATVLVSPKNREKSVNSTKYVFKRDTRASRKAGVPQGTKLGPWLFVIIINDLNIRNASLWKYVDDTTVSETIPKGAISHAQLIVDEVVEWSRLNRFQLNTDKCKELRISFAKNKPDLPPLMPCGNTLEVVDSAKLLGVTITSNLTWNLHVAEVIKKASKRLYFLLQLKRDHVPKSDLVTFYTSCVRSVCDYAVQVFHSSLPLYLINDLERVQKRALSIIYPYVSYNEALVQAGLSRLADHHQDLCKSLFDNISEDKNHRLHHLLPPQFSTTYSLRNPRTFNIKFNKRRANNTFFNAQCHLVNSFKAQDF